MNEFDDPVAQWLLSAEQCLSDAAELTRLRLANPSGSGTRPAAILFGYFLEGLLKAIVVRKGSATNKQFYQHVRPELAELAGLGPVSGMENELLNDLNDCVTWGKYPEPGKGKQRTLVRSGNLFFHDQTYVFNSPIVLAHLLRFCKRALLHAEAELCGTVPVSDDDFVSPLLQRMKETLQRALEDAERANPPPSGRAGLERPFSGKER